MKNEYTFKEAHQYMLDQGVTLSYDEFLDFMKREGLLNPDGTASAIGLESGYLNQRVVHVEEPTKLISMDGFAIILADLADSYFHEKPQITRLEIHANLTNCIARLGISDEQKISLLTNALTGATVNMLNILQERTVDHD